MKGPKFMSLFCQKMNKLIQQGGGTLYVAGSGVSINHIHQILWYRYVRPTLDLDSQKLEYGTVDKADRDLFHTQLAVVMDWLKLNRFEVITSMIHKTIIEQSETGAYYYANPTGLTPIQLLNQVFPKPVKGAQMIIENDPFGKVDIDFTESAKRFEKLGLSVDIIN